MYKKIATTVILALSPIPPVWADGDTMIIDGVGTLPLVERRVHDGTLPLRLGGEDGTLPLRFRGRVVPMTGTGDQMDAELIITRIQHRSSSEWAAESLGSDCRLRGSDVTAHSASGTMNVGSKAYSIRMICFDHGSSDMEIVAHGQESSKTSLVSPLAAKRPSRLEGRLYVTSSGSTSRYHMVVER